MTDSRTLFVLVTLGSPSHVFIVNTLIRQSSPLQLNIVFRCLKFKPDLAIFSAVEDFMISLLESIECLISFSVKLFIICHL